MPEVAGVVQRAERQVGASVAAGGPIGLRDVALVDIGGNRLSRTRSWFLRLQLIYLDNVIGRTSLGGFDDSQSLDEIDSEILVVTFDGEAVEQPAPYFGAQDASGTASQPEAGFAPDALYQEFCWAVSVINSRPQPAMSSKRSLSRVRTSAPSSPM